MLLYRGEAFPSQGTTIFPVNTPKMDPLTKAFGFRYSFCRYEANQFPHKEVLKWKTNCPLP